MSYTKPLCNSIWHYIDAEKLKRGLADVSYKSTLESRILTKLSETYSCVKKISITYKTEYLMIDIIPGAEMKGIDSFGHLTFHSICKEGEKIHYSYPGHFYEKISPDEIRYASIKFGYPKDGSKTYTDEYTYNSTLGAGAGAGAIDMTPLSRTRRLVINTVRDHSNVLNLEKSINLDHPFVTFIKPDTFNQLKLYKAIAIAGQLKLANLINTSDLAREIKFEEGTDNSRVIASVSFTGRIDDLKKELESDIDRDKTLPHNISFKIANTPIDKLPTEYPGMKKFIRSLITNITKNESYLKTTIKNAINEIATTINKDKSINDCNLSTTTSQEILKKRLVAVENPVIDISNNNIPPNVSYIESTRYLDFLQGKVCKPIFNIALLITRTFIDELYKDGYNRPVIDFEGKWESSEPTISPPTSTLEKYLNLDSNDNFYFKNKYLKYKAKYLALKNQLNL
jgi:hypothetical protein